MKLGGAAAAAGALVVAMSLAGCGSVAPQSTYTATVTVAPTSAPAPQPSSTVTFTTPATPIDTPTPLPTSTSADPGRPADQCPDSSLGVTIQPADGGGGAGSEFFNVLFTNTGGSSCVLRGTPGVSVVGDGAQLGPAADRVEQGVKDVRLAVGGTVAAPLRIVDIGDEGGPLTDCTVVKGDGYRVYPPHSTRAYLVKDADAVACKDGPVFMTASPVIRFTD